MKNKTNVTGPMGKCGDYCARQPPEECPIPGKGNWTASGEYPDCKCRYNCAGNVTGNQTGNGTGNQTGNGTGNITPGNVSLTIVLEDDEFIPSEVNVMEGQNVTITLDNQDASNHTFTLEEFGIDVLVEAEETETVNFIPDEEGNFTFESTLDEGMNGTLIVSPFNATGNQSGNLTGNITGNVSKTILAEENKWIPGSFQVEEGQQVFLTIYNEDNHDHTFELPAFGIGEELPPQSTTEISFVASMAGSFPYGCEIHPQMDGMLTVLAANVSGNASGNETGNQTGNGTNVTGNNTLSLAIELDDEEFSPDQITVEEGKHVVLTLVNLDGQDHTFVSEDLGIDVEIDEGETVIVEFDAEDAGEYDFWCTIHDGMDGTIIITETNVSGNVSGNVTGNESAPVTYNIVIEDNVFLIEEISILKDSIVQFVIINNDESEHTFTLEAYDIDVVIPASSETTVSFIANEEGIFVYQGDESSMEGELEVG